MSKILADYYSLLMRTIALLIEAFAHNMVIVRPIVNGVSVNGVVLKRRVISPGYEQWNDKKKLPH